MTMVYPGGTIRDGVIATENSSGITFSLPTAFLKSEQLDKDIHKGIKKTNILKNLFFIIRTLSCKKLSKKEQTCSNKDYCISNIKSWPV